MKYGDYDNVTKDAKILKEILGRQGSNLLMEVIAESIGESSVKFKFTKEENTRLMQSTVSELKELILERI